jgi:hypothetical protein
MSEYRAYVTDHLGQFIRALELGYSMTSARQRLPLAREPKPLHDSRKAAGEAGIYRLRLIGASARLASGACAFGAVPAI